MSAKRKPRRSPAKAGLAALASVLEGHRIPGGCVDCDAYQTLRRDPNHAGVTHLDVHHDDSCPFLAKYSRRA